MAIINFDHPQTLADLVARIAHLNLKIAEVRRRKDKSYGTPNVPVDAGIAVSHLYLVDSILESISLDTDFGAGLEAIAGKVGRFKSTDGNLAPTDAELLGTIAYHSAFETVVLLEGLLARIEELFGKADKEQEEERYRKEAAYQYGEDCRMEVCRNQRRG